MGEGEGALEAALFGSDSDSDLEKSAGAKGEEGKSSGAEEVKAEEKGRGPDAGDVEGMEDLFGGDSEDSESAGGDAKPGAPLEDSSDSEEAAAPKEDEEAITFDMTADRDVDTLDKSPDAHKFFLAKLSNIVGIEKQEFSEATPGADSGNRFVVRWRVNSSGEVESNSRLVRWSDGSQTLQVGDEHLDVLRQDIRSDNVFVYAHH